MKFCSEIWIFGHMAVQIVEVIMLHVLFAALGFSSAIQEAALPDTDGQDVAEVHTEPALAQYTAHDRAEAAASPEDSSMPANTLKGSSSFAKGPIREYVSHLLAMAVTVPGGHPTDVHLHVLLQQTPVTAGIRPTNSLEEFFGEDMTMLELNSHIELAKQLRNAQSSSMASDSSQPLRADSDDPTHAGKSCLAHAD
jgi:hypothetical protein